MKIRSVQYGARYNTFSVICNCNGKPFDVRVNQLIVVCPKCGAQENIMSLRDRFFGIDGKPNAESVKI